MSDASDSLSLSSSLDFPSGSLLKRKDFLETDAAAKRQPHRTYYYKKDVSADRRLRLIPALPETCASLLTCTHLGMHAIHTHTQYTHMALGQVDTSHIVSSCTQLLSQKPISVSSSSSVSMSPYEMDAETRARILFVRGTSYVRQQQYAYAIEDLSEVIDSGESFSGEPLAIESTVEDVSLLAALYNRGVAFSKLDDLNSAIEDFSAVLEMDEVSFHGKLWFASSFCFSFFFLFFFFFLALCPALSILTTSPSPSRTTSKPRTRGLPVTMRRASW